MRIAHLRKPSRQGFTLIELLVVIAIIAILMALTGAAVMNVMKKGPIVKSTADINELATAVGTFKSENGNIPSRIRLCKKLATYTTSPSAIPNLDKDSIRALTMISPKITDPTGPWSAAGAAGGIDWNNAGNMVTDGDVILEGDQCLVFFLGGLQTGATTGAASCLGFATDPKSPANLASGGNPRKAFDFKSKQLVPVHNTGATANNYLSYVDQFGKNKPYVYFSSYNRDNGYSKYGSSDSSLTSPLMVSAGRFQNPSGFQIISAGPDFTFGNTDDITNTK